MVSGVGGVGGQVGLGAIGEARGVGTAFVVGGVVAAGAVPLFASLRRSGDVADRIVGESAGAECSSPSGIPAVAMVEGHVVDELSPVRGASPG
jgi:hypothetical protein